MPTYFFKIEFKSAYYSIYHDLLLQNKHREESLEEILYHSEIPLALYESVKQVMAQPGAISALISDTHLAHMLQQSLVSICKNERKEP